MRCKRDENQTAKTNANQLRTQLYLNREKDGNCTHDQKRDGRRPDPTDSERYALCNQRIAAIAWRAIALSRRKRGASPLVVRQRRQVRFRLYLDSHPGGGLRSVGLFGAQLMTLRGASLNP